MRWRCGLVRLRRSRGVHRARARFVHDARERALRGGAVREARDRSRGDRHVRLAPAARGEVLRGRGAGGRGAERISAGERDDRWATRAWIRARGAKRWRRGVIDDVRVAAARVARLVAARGRRGPRRAINAAGRGRRRSCDAATIARAEDQRRAKDVPVGARTSHDVRVRREAARALARIADQDTVDGLMRALEDEDRTTAAWGAYGLGMVCKGHEEAYVHAARGARDVVRRRRGSATMASVARDAIDVRDAIARAIGRCGGATAEATLAAWVRRRDAWSEVAAYALGDVAAKRGALGDETMTALVERGGAARRAQSNEAALYPFARLDRVPDPFAPRVAKAALTAMAHARAGARVVRGPRARATRGRRRYREVERIVRRSRVHARRARRRGARRCAGWGTTGARRRPRRSAQLAPEQGPARRSTRVGRGRLRRPHVARGFARARRAEEERSRRSTRSLRWSRRGRRRCRSGEGWRSCDAARRRRCPKGPTTPTC